MTDQPTLLEQRQARRAARDTAWTGASAAQAQGFTDEHLAELLSAVQKWAHFDYKETNLAQESEDLAAEAFQRFLRAIDNRVAEGKEPFAVYELADTWAKKTLRGRLRNAARDRRKTHRRERRVDDFDAIEAKTMRDSTGVYRSMERTEGVFDAETARNLSSADWTPEMWQKKYDAGEI